jgi:hypothetical protein
MFLKSWTAESLPISQTFRASRKMRPIKNTFLRTLSHSAVVLVLRRRAACGPRKGRIHTMQRLTVVRYTTKPGHAGENEALSRAVFAQLRSAPPDGVAYALLRDGNEFIHVFLNLKADESAPVTELPAFKTFQQGVVERCEIPPRATRLAAHLVDCYGFGGPAS